MIEASEMERAEASARPGWDERAWSELVALDDVACLLLTDGRGRTLRQHVRVGARDDLGELADIAVSALAAAGVQLELGRLRQFAACFAGGIVIGAASARERVVVLARFDANLGRLLMLLRLLFSEQE